MGSQRQVGGARRDGWRLWGETGIRRLGGRGPGNCPPAGGASRAHSLLLGQDQAWWPPGRSSWGCLDPTFVPSLTQRQTVPTLISAPSGPKRGEPRQEWPVRGRAPARSSTYRRPAGHDLGGQSLQSSTPGRGSGHCPGRPPAGSSGNHLEGSAAWTGEAAMSQWARPLEASRPLAPLCQQLPRGWAWQGHRESSRTTCPAHIPGFILLPTGSSQKHPHTFCQPPYLSS